jgi:hypothetical protein
MSAELPDPSLVYIPGLQAKERSYHRCRARSDRPEMTSKILYSGKSMALNTNAAICIHVPIEDSA